MRKISIFLALMISLLPLYSAVPVADELTSVYFASKGDNVYGFSKDYVNTLGKVETLTDGTAENPRIMEPAIQKGVYTTDVFNFFAQIFSKERVTIQLQCNGPLSNGSETIDYSNVGTRTGNIFTGSKDNIGKLFTLVDESKSLSLNDCDYPRKYSFDFEFQVAFEDVEGKSGEFAASVTFLISTDEGGIS